MIYLNNAATSYPKPPCVVEAVQACLMGAPVSQYRGSAELRKEDTTVLCKKKLGELLHIREWKRIVFTSGATESANRLICGLDYENRGIMTSEIEHNSILRPLWNQNCVKEQKISIVPCTKNGTIEPLEVEKTILKAAKESEKGNYPSVFFVNHCSNVTGQIQNLEAITKICHKYGIFVIADLSQSAGSIRVDADAWQLDGIIFTGHKSLFGMQGIGGYYLREGISLKPLLYGGTGRDSARLLYEEEYEYEVGTQNQPGIESLLAGVSYILEEGMENIIKKEQHLMTFLYQEMEKISQVKLYNRYSIQHGPVMSMNIKGLDSADVAYILQNVYGITVRTGLHCAPLIHKEMGTEEKGTLRISVSYLTKQEEIEAFVKAIREICSSLQ